MWGCISAILQGLLKLIGMGDRAQAMAQQKAEQDTGRKLQQGDDLAASSLSQQRADAAAANAPLSRTEFEEKAEKGEL